MDMLEMEIANDEEIIDSEVDSNEDPIDTKVDFDGDFVTTLTDECIVRAIKQYLEENGLPLDASFAKIGEVVLIADNWIGEESPYSQVVNIDGVTENSQVDLTPNIEQLKIFYEKDLTFLTENDGGVVTIYAIGQKPENDYTIQVTITEVAYG
jgi:hypothetical protein